MEIAVPEHVPLTGQIGMFVSCPLTGARMSCVPPA